MRSYLLFSYLVIFYLSQTIYSQVNWNADSVVDSTIDVVVSGYIHEHDEEVLESFLDGYSSYNDLQFSGRTLIHNSINLLNSLSFADENEYDIVIRSYTGLLEAIELSSDYPELQIIMPSGSNSFIESFSGDIENCPVIVTGAGTLHNETGYTIEFFSIDPTGENLSSFSNGYIAGQIAFLSDFLGLNYDEARTLSRSTASQQGNYDYFDGFGRVNIEDAINTVLPVELTMFTASEQSNSVYLNWHTETEVNNLGFEIERKFITDSTQYGNNSIWVKIGFIPGYGTTTNPHEYFYSDDIRKISTTTIAYRLKQIDFNGTFEYSDEVFVEHNSPVSFNLKQNYPNPFNPSTIIKYSISNQPAGETNVQFVMLKVYNVLGREVAALVNEEQSAGNYEIEFSAKGESASGGNTFNLPSGVYFYTLSAGNFTETKKMILLR